ncbi:MAG TPA: phosphomannomutase/phosphoglucomutase [Solirubrobacteraceae bacterium]|jgi:phosphomannomutase|nr:phosphomannomutase/phosphoglucomutase [Solirubrobacteraceae bacterium]
MPATFSPDIFKAYDIRGLYGEQIDGDVAESIGRAFARVLANLAEKPVGDLRVGLGRDMRLSAPELAERYRHGLLSRGVHVLDAGQVGSEMLYFMVGSRELDGGLMCTASHNPKAYTGAKLVREGAIALSGDSGIQDIRREVEAQLEAGTTSTPSERQGTVEEVDLYEEFQTAALRFIDADAVRSARPLKVVLDGGNGMAGPMVGPLLESLDLELIETYWTPDGHFPDHEPNPLLPENREFIIAKVRETGADLGIAWDGDADRCFFIDDTGRFVDGDFLTALLAESLLGKASSPEHPEAILYDVRASRAVADTVRAAGGVPYVNRVGHAFFKTRMRKEGSLFGGEVSGHYYFRDFYCADSGTIPALLVLELLAREGRSLSELLARYRSRYFISGEINSEVTDAGAKMEEIAERYSDARQERLDGISIDYADWHFNVRSSNTEPLLRLCLESLVSPEDMERRRDEVLALIRS